MNQLVKLKWVAALRSGQYKQVRKRLAHLRRQDVQYCCLGVLCDLAVKAGVITPPVHDDYNDLVYDGQTCTPPNVVKLWSDVDPGLNHSHTLDRLTDMNDNQYASFNHIADWIETNL